MRGITTIWAWVSAAIGAMVMVLLYFYAGDYGTWVDEVGPLPVSPPTFVLPFMIGALGVVLLVGGIVAGLTGTGERTSIS